MVQISLFPSRVEYSGNLPVTKCEEEEGREQMEAERFKEAVTKVGWKLNKELAKLVGTRTASQVASLKNRFTRNNPLWVMENVPMYTPPQSASTRSSGATTRSSVSTPIGECREGMATPEQPFQPPPLLTYGIYPIPFCMGPHHEARGPRGAAKYPSHSAEGRQGPNTSANLHTHWGGWGGSSTT